MLQKSMQFHVAEKHTNWGLLKSIAAKKQYNRLKGYLQTSYLFKKDISIFQYFLLVLIQSINFEVIKSCLNYYLQLSLNRRGFVHWILEFHHFGLLLFHLIPSLWTRIFSYLPINDLKSVVSTCKTLSVAGKTNPASNWKQCPHFS